MDVEVQAYEHLRSAVLRAQARPDGLAAVAYHGLLGGLKIICSMATPASTSTSTSTSMSLQVSAIPVAPPPTDEALVRLLANMVLHYQQEVCHVI